MERKRLNTSFYGWVKRSKNEFEYIDMYLDGTRDESAT